MTKLAPAMFAACEREAKSKGPRSVAINGTMRTAYCLSRGELNNIFRKNGFRRDGVAWLHYVMDFRDVFEAVAPSDAVILIPNERWFVAFTNVTKSEYLDLQLAAEDFGSPVLAVEP